MGFHIVKTDSQNSYWLPVGYPTTTDTVYVGAIVKWSYNGVVPLGGAGANPDVTNYPLGIVRALNNRTPAYSSTYNAEYVASVQSQALQLARDWAFQEGMYSKSDPQPLALVDIITPSTVIEGPIRNAAIGTAPGVVTFTTGCAAGITGGVHGNADVALLANNNMYYARTGLNRGLCRGSYANSQTTPTFYTAWPYAIAIGDTMVATNVGLGEQKIDFNVENLWVENSAALTNYFSVFVLSMDLREAGKESLQFSFIKQAD